MHHGRVQYVGVDDGFREDLRVEDRSGKDLDRCPAVMRGLGVEDMGMNGGRKHRGAEVLDSDQEGKRPLQHYWAAPSFSEAVKAATT